MNTGTSNPFAADTTQYLDYELSVPVIIDKAGGKVTDTQTIALSADLKTLTITVHTSGRDRANVLVLERE